MFDEMPRLMTSANRIVAALLLATPGIASAQSEHAGHGGMSHEGAAVHDHAAHATMPSDCGAAESWNFEWGMCMPLPTGKDPGLRGMLHANAFVVSAYQSGPRGRDGVSSPNMIMADMGRELSDRHFLDLNLMLTFEKWTFPEKGYPLLLQIGEEDAKGDPYLDAQHPHTSPIMGLTLSDTWRISDENHLHFFFAPRGQSTDGPVAFMHRVTGMVNPDAPLGHHIGQDVGHISSTVLGGSLGLGATTLEGSVFHGEEPEPARVELSLGVPDSTAVRVIQEFGDDTFAMASFAYVNDPEHHDPSVPYVLRYSGSLYQRFGPIRDWMFHNAFIVGAIARYDHAPSLFSFAEEFAIEGQASSFWGRFEVLQRTPDQLQIEVDESSTLGQWVASLNLGYTQRIVNFHGATLAVGGSVTQDLLPQDFLAAYGGNPWGGKFFLQISGMGQY